jgi:hypothetical protein
MARVAELYAPDAGHSTLRGAGGESPVAPVGRTMVSTRGGPDSALERLGVTTSGVKPSTFASSVAKWWAGLGARVCVGLAGAAIVGWGARHGIYGLLGSASS